MMWRVSETGGQANRLRQLSRSQRGELFVSAEDVPNWRLADKVRRLVLDMGYFLSEVIQQYNEAEIEDLEPGPAQGGGRWGESR